MGNKHKIGATKTGVVILLVSFILLVWEFYVLLTGGETISARIIEWSHVNLMIPFCLGLLAGHFFWTKE